MAEESAPNLDAWREIENAASSAFDSYVNKNAPDLAATLQRSAVYAKADTDAAEIVVDRRAFLFGLVAYGLVDSPSPSFGNIATWIAGWIAARAGSPLLSTVQRGVTEKDHLINLHAHGAHVVASNSMRSCAGLAVQYARQTAGRDVADLRHFIAAFIENPSVATTDMAAVGWTAKPEDMAGLQRDLYGRIAENPEQSEDLAAWRLILHVDEPAIPVSDASSPPPPPPPSEVSGFTSDRAENLAAGDPLELLADVKAFARLICLEEAEPPLSIGLFGGWGSGKSTFMQLLEGEIDALTQKTRDAARPKVAADASAGRAPVFIRNVVQVRFNAWHFADANLWASLTAEFFDQFRAGGYSRLGKTIHAKVVERVNAHVHTLTSAANSARQDLLASETALHDAQRARDDAVAGLESKSGREFRQTIVDAVTKAFEQHKGDLTELGFGTSGDKDINDFLDLSVSLRTWFGQLKALLQFVFERGWRAALAVAGFAAVAASIYAMSQFDLANEPFGLTSLNVVALLAGAGAFARAVLPGVKIIGGLIESTSGFAGRLDDKLKKEIKQVAQAEDKLQRAAAETEARRAAAERAAKSLARYVDPDSKTGNPPRLLRFMLEDDPDTRALEKEIGLISRVRRLFQAIDEIVQEEKQKDENAADGDKRRDPNVPDRIVIYIDDLDRCTPAQVYAVLQAIHLLLAFNLFVVVVGVDVAWVQEALVHELRPTLNVPTSTTRRAKSKIDERKLAIRYLEKIFQLPFWLRRLTTEGADGGSYGRFIRTLLSRNLATANDPGPLDAALASTATSGADGGNGRKMPASALPQSLRSRRRRTRAATTFSNRATTIPGSTRRWRRSA